MATTAGGEKQTQVKIIKYLETLRNVWFTKTIVCTTRGVPDILVCYKGRFISIECKSPSGRLTELQRYNSEQIRLAGGYAITAYSPADVQDFFSLLDCAEVLKNECKNKK